MTLSTCFIWYHVINAIYDWQVVWPVVAVLIAPVSNDPCLLPLDFYFSINFLPRFSIYAGRSIKLVNFNVWSTEYVIYIYSLAFVSWGWWYTHIKCHTDCWSVDVTLRSHTGFALFPSFSSLWGTTRAADQWISPCCRFQINLVAWMYQMKQKCLWPIKCWIIWDILDAVSHDVPCIL